MSSERADYQDADIVLKMYDLRRETVMRDSREAILRDFLPRSYEEFKTITSTFQHPLNRAFRQVSSYWEMCYGFAKHGIVNADFLAESGGEGFFFYARLASYVEKFRAEGSPTAFQNTEWMINNSKVAAQRFEIAKKRVEALLKERG